MKNSRQPDHPVMPLIVERWSPRSFTSELLPSEQRASLFEAARWSPSCFNEQPWRFLYAERGSAHWSVFLDILVEANRLWAQDAALLIALVSTTRFSRNGRPNDWHSLDAGAAWQSLALQAWSMGWAAHAMAGFDREKALIDLRIPDDCRIEAMIAVGRPAPARDLPESLREREMPSGRNPIGDFAFEGHFPAS